MKELLILRHAKSSWKHPELDDHDRPLNKRGKADAPRMGKLIVKEGMVPERILSSTAKRARSTATFVAEACGYPGAPLLTPRLYLAGPVEYRDLLSELEDGIGSAMVVGHNPGIEELVEELTGAAERMPTAALARIALELDRWVGIVGPVRGRLLGLWRPKELSG
jgi:phosphohistidine phosphatase